MITLDIEGEVKAYIKVRNEPIPEIEDFELWNHRQATKLDMLAHGVMLKAIKELEDATTQSKD